MMDRQLAHMVRLIDDLLDVSRISRNKMELRRRRVLLADVVSSAVETARPADRGGRARADRLAAARAGLPRRRPDPAGPGVRQPARPTAPSTPSAGGHIWLAAERRGDEVVVSVRDTGIGIPAEALPQHLRHVHPGGPAASSGAPAGSASAWPWSRAWSRCTAARSRPRARGRARAARSPSACRSLDGPRRSRRRSAGRGTAGRVRAEAAHPGGGRQPGLAAVDGDDAPSCWATRCATAHDGVEAVEVAGAVPARGDPDGRRHAAAQRPRRHPAHPRAAGGDMTIIALTGWGQEGDRERSREAGCDGHLVKPVNLPDLEKLLGELRSFG